MHVLTNFIGGVQTAPASGAYLDVIEPGTGDRLARVPDSSAADVDAAVSAAAAAFPAWSSTPASERSRLLLKLADLIDHDTERLAIAESTDTGKPLSLARAVDIPRAAANLRFFATAILHTSTDTHDSDGAAPGSIPGAVPALNYTLRRPRGIAGCISPWNLPLYLFTWKFAPALATGNTIVGKPSEVTPLTAWMLGDLAREAGLPPGVLNIIHGTGPAAGAAIVSHPDIPTITFTGSTPVGRWIGETCGRSLKRVSLELGGKNPFIIFDDADLDGTSGGGPDSGAISTAARAAFSNQGQICLCGSRLLVHEKIHDRVVADLVERAKSLKVGDPLEPSTQFGAVTSRAHFEKIDGLVKLAKDLGGTILTGGGPVPKDRLPARCKDGFFYQPTVIAGLDPSCRVEQEEIFGPVVTIQKFRDEDQALALANGTPYGLASTLFTRDLSRAHRFAARLDAGIVWVNCWMVRDLRTPFGGVKQSGVGREGGLDALRFFTEPKNVCVRV
jgi:aminomuconate-semialdehyde/2-hydroxymuconate-6-semialdehyde dehydrogenase